MRLQTNLVRRGSRFYYRGRVPEDLKHHFRKNEILVSLKTSDRQLAEFALSQLKVKLLAEFNALRGHVINLDQVNINRPFTSGQLNASFANEKFITIDTLIEHWAAQSEKRPRTLMEVETAKKRLVRITGHNNAAKISKADGIGLKDSLLAQGLSAATIQKQINLLRAVFQTAVNDDLITSNPFQSVKLSKPKYIQKPRVPFTSNDLKLIFNSSIFTDGFRQSGGAGEAAFWLPKIALWTGMRLEEIGQLLVSDIRYEASIPYINVSTDSENGQRLKTTSSNRRIPIHHKLKEAGLIDYAAMMKEAGHTRLFPLLKSVGARQLTASWSQWFSRYLRGHIGIVDSRKTFHSFRHGFKEACRLYGIPKDIHDELTGHASSDVGDGYGGDQYPLLPLQIAIHEIKFDL